MGQYWLLLDLDARKTMGLGKLGESFFGMADDIFDALFRVQFVPVHLSFATASTTPNEESERCACRGICHVHRLTYAQWIADAAALRAHRQGLCFTQ